MDFENLESVVIRFAGDSGDGMQLTGSQFTISTALAGHELATFPDFPAEIRAPQGTTFGVSAFQINFGSSHVSTPGDEPDVLVCMNPAALKTNLKLLRPGGMVVVDTGAFNKRNIQKAGYDSNPLETDLLAEYQTLELDITALTMESVKEFGLGNKEAVRSKNMWTLGLMLWMFGRDRGPITTWLEKKFANKPEIAEANIAALNAGHIYGETAELSSDLKKYHIQPAKQEKGTYRTVTGSEAMAWGLAAAGQLSGLDVMLGSYPITPASPVLHQLSNMKEYGVTTFQAEDEIAAICAAIGASFGGALAVTSSSGPGIALKGEAIGLAISAELPLVVVNSQRGGPSTGLPTKTEQSDLYQAVYGRNGDAPMPVIASSTPGDCFYVAIEAARLSLKYMTPVMLLTDGFIANAAEPWKLPDINQLAPIEVNFAGSNDLDEDGNFNPFKRDMETLARVWAKPGTPGLEHRIGGLEKGFDNGHISYDGDNHQKMTNIRRDKVNNIANDIPEQDLLAGSEDDDVLVIGWGSTRGAIEQAVSRARQQGLKVAHAHLRYINPLPRNLANMVAKFKRVLVPEMNDGQLMTLWRDKLLLDATSLSKVEGQPFKIREILEAIERECAAAGDSQ